MPDKARDVNEVTHSVELTKNLMFKIQGEAARNSEKQPASQGIQTAADTANTVENCTLADTVSQILQSDSKARLLDKEAMAMPDSPPTEEYDKKGEEKTAEFDKERDLAQKDGEEHLEGGESENNHVNPSSSKIHSNQIGVISSNVNQPYEGVPVADE